MTTETPTGEGNPAAITPPGWRRAAIAGLVLWLGLVALGVARLDELRFNNDRWLPPEHPVEGALNELHDEFEPGEIISLLLSFPEGVLTADGFGYLRRLTEDLENLEGVDEALSPATAPTIVAHQDTLEILSFGEALEEQLLDLEQLRRKFRDSHYYGKLLSRDEKLAVVRVQLDSLDQPQRRLILVDSVRRQLAAAAPPAGVQFIGDALVKERLDVTARAELGRLLLLASIVFALVLGAILRNLARTLLILATTFGCSAVGLSWAVWLGHEFTSISLILPVLLVVIAAADGLHILACWDRRRLESPPFEALRATFRQTWFPCLLTSVSTAVGFGAFALSELLPVRHFGQQALPAILCAYPLILLPVWGALVLIPGPLARGSVTPPGERPPNEAAPTDTAQRIGAWVKARPGTLALAGIAFCALLGAGLVRFHTETNLLSVFFAADSPIRQAVAEADARLGGSSSIEIMLKSDEADAFNALAAMELVRDTGNRLGQIPGVNSVESYLMPLNIVQEALTGVPDDLPHSDAELAQTLWFLELSRSESDHGVLASFLNFNNSIARLALRIPDLDSSALTALLETIEEQLAQLDGRYQQVLTGFGVKVHSLNTLVLETQVESFVLTFVLIALLFLPSFGLRLALAGLLVQLLPLLATLGLISLLGLPFNFATILVAGISLGLSVDNSIHYLFRYRLAGGGERGALEALAHIATPIATASAVVATGLGVLATSELVVLQRFGYFTALAIVLSVLGALILLPALLIGPGKTARNAG